MRRLNALAVAVPAVLALTTVAAPVARAQARRITVDDMARLVSVATPEISPDGKTIAFVVSRVDTVADQSTRSLYLLDIATGASRPLTHDRSGVAGPQWSPAGDRLAFLAAAGPKGKEAEQVFVLRLDGGEARQITAAENGVEQFAWRPDGKEIAFVTADDPPNQAAIEKHHDAFEVGDNGYLDREAPTPSHVWLAPADSGAARRLTSGTWSIVKSHPPGPPSSPMSWSPDGKSLLIGRQEDPHFGDGDRSTVRIIDASSGTERKLTSHDVFEGNAVWSPDGAHIVYAYPAKGDPNRGADYLVTTPAGGDGTDVTAALDRNLTRAIWMPDGKSFLTAGHDGATVAYWIQPIAGGAARKLDLGEVVPSSSFWFDASVGKDGAIAFPASEPGRPPELYYLAPAAATPRRLTDFNHDVAALDLGRTEAIAWPTDKFTANGIVVYPPQFDKARKYPLVLLIHGGPTSSTTIGFSSLAQMLAAQGFVVFQPNYRGSDNLGDAYQDAITDDAGDGPGRDVMAGVAALAKRGFIDTTRVGVSGWSYGGYMTTWLIGHYHNWKAAMAGAPVTNMVDQYNLADFNVLDRFTFRGSPWKSEKQMERYREQSPITYAPKVTTPTLLMHDVGDDRVTITQSYYFYHALKDNGVPVTFIAIPTAGHFPGDPVRQMDVMRRWVGWFVEHLRETNTTTR